MANGLTRPGHRPLLAVLAAGVVLHAGAIAMMADQVLSASSLRILVLVLLPYAGLYGLGRVFKGEPVVLAGACIVLAIDACAFGVAHIQRTSSTAGLIHIAATLLHLTVVLPAVGLLAWWRRRR